VILHNVLESIRLLAEASRSFNDRCAAGIEPNEKRIREHLDNSIMLVTALNPHIGYEQAAQISLKAYRENLTLREAALRLGFVTVKQFDEWVRGGHDAPTGVPSRRRIGRGRPSLPVELSAHGHRFCIMLTPTGRE
jgi:fumarate hydratase class II